MDDKLTSALVTGLSSLLVALIGYAAARRKDGKARAERKPLPLGTLEQRLWGGVLAVILALVVAEAVAPVFGARIDFPPQAYPFLISGLVFWLYLALSGKGGNDGKGQP